MADNQNPDGAERARKVDERIHALLSMVEDQETAVRAALGGLALERAALAKERVALVDQAEKMERLSDKLSGQLLDAISKVPDAAGQAAAAAVSKVLQGTVVTAIGIAATAAKPTLESFKEAVGSARAVQLELKKAVKDFRREWLLVVAALLGVVMVAASIMGYLAVVWQRDELAKVMATRDKLQAEVNALQEQAEQARRNNGRKPAK